MSHQWTMEDFESIYSPFQVERTVSYGFCSNECIRPKRFYSGVPSCCAKAALSRKGKQ